MSNINTVKDVTQVNTSNVLWFKLIFIHKYTVKQYVVTIS